jgi:hypothetical protein
VYKRAKSGGASFYCSRRGTDFATADAFEAFQYFVNISTNVLSSLIAHVRSVQQVNPQSHL